MITARQQIYHSKLFANRMSGKSLPYGSTGLSSE
jgi:hypothetical protein